MMESARTVGQLDRSQHEQMFRRHHAEVRSFARRIMGNESDADDLASATFEAVARAFATYRNEGEVRAFLFGICANLARTLKRGLSRQRAAMNRLESAAPFITGDVEAEIERIRLGRQAVAAFEALSGKSVV